MSSDRATRAPLLVIAALLACFVVLSLPGALRESTTYDERHHAKFGHKLLTRGDLRRGVRFNAMMPWNAVQAAPGVALEKVTGAPFYPTSDPFALSREALVLGRLATLLVGGVGCGIAVSALAHARAGRRAAVAAAALFALEPNLLAHAHYVTTDVAGTATSVLIVLAAHHLAVRPDAWRAAALGGAIGLGLLAKYTALHVVVGVTLGLFPVVTRRSLARAALLVLVTAVVAALVIDVGYAFRDVPGRFPEPSASRKFATLASFFGRPPTPLAGGFWDGLDQIAGVMETGVFFGPLYLLGELDLAQRGWLHYYPVVLSFKLPLPLIALLLARPVLGGPQPRARSFVLATSLGVLLAYFVLVFRVQIGVRYLLPVIALALVPAAEALARLAGSRRGRVIAALLLAWQGASIVSWAPSFLPYTNELVLDRTKLYRIYADSNVDWGQAEDAALAWAESERARGRVVHVRPDEPVTGTVLVSVNDFVGIGRFARRYEWLRGREPVGHVDGAFLVFEVEATPPR